jgi:hypothetical protein
MNNVQYTSRRDSPKRAFPFTARFAIACVSALIALIWFSQFLVSIPLSLITRGIRQSWPIVDYPMYNAPHFTGEEIPRLSLVGIRDNSEEIDVLPEDIPGGYWHFQIFAKAVRDAHKDVIEDVVRMYEAGHKVRLVALRVEDRPLVWKNAGAEPAPTRVLQNVWLDSAEHSGTFP